MSPASNEQHDLLVRVAREAMIECGLEPELPAPALAEANALAEVSPDGSGDADLRGLPWCSIDNEDSRDLDQLTVAEGEMDGGVRVQFVAIADVSATVAPGSAIDAHAGVNTTSVYTPARIFPMLPERLSTDLTSLNPGRGPPGRRRRAGRGRGRARASHRACYRAIVHNHAQLAYPPPWARWLEGGARLPPAPAAVPGLDENLRLQDAWPVRLQAHRHEQGALDARHARGQGAASTATAVQSLAVEDNEPRQRADRGLHDRRQRVDRAVPRGRGFPVLRRVVRSPERWPRIVGIAGAQGVDLPRTPTRAPLSAFLAARRAADPLRFPDLSLAIDQAARQRRVRCHATRRAHRRSLRARRDPLRALHGAQPPLPRPAHAAPGQGRAGRRAVPVRRRAAGRARGALYSPEDQAQKVERRVRKSAAACFLVERIGEEFAGFVTGASPKGTWVRLLDPPVEGRVVEGMDDLDVGDAVRVRLVDADPARGFIDLAVLS